ncbi:MAG TPA: Hsp70 family protein, partial [Dehalococcoidia bacterium]|nr:Hsp70 family protein [Dehalococcoidia bacterium]
GTLDVTVVECGVEMRVLATGGVPIGGDLLDRRIVEARMLRHFGEGATYSRARLPVPRHLLARVLDWQTLFLLNRPEELRVIDEILAGASHPRELRNLRTLVTRNYGAALFRAVERGKQELSGSGHTRITLTAEEIDIAETLTREEFEGIIRRQHDAVRDTVLECVRDTALDPEQVRCVVTTGGSSRIPMFRRTLKALFPLAELVEQDAFTSVAAGLALAGFQRA